MRVELVTVGDELLLGVRVNAHAAWLGQRLAEAGVEVVRNVAIGDERAAIAAELARARSQADAVVMTGGLGPTGDDLTREALAQAAGAALRRDRRLERTLRGRLDELGVPAGPGLLRQADVPEGATVLTNEGGTAPGLRLDLGRAVVYALPGVPSEMERMFTDSVLPDLLARAATSQATVSRTVHTAAMWESGVARRLSDLEGEVAADPGLTLAYLASPGRVGVRVTGRAATRKEAGSLVAPVEERVRELLGDAVYGADGESLEQVVHRLLAARGATVAVAESLTGGLVAERLTAVAGASATFLGGVVAYSTEVKTALLGVPEPVLQTSGAVDPEVARAMAAGARDRFAATYGLGVTGVAGPGFQERRPPGTLHVAVAGPGGDHAGRSPLLPGTDRAHNREQAVVHVLDLLRRHLL